MKVVLIPASSFSDTGDEWPECSRHSCSRRSLYQGDPVLNIMLIWLRLTLIMAMAMENGYFYGRKRSAEDGHVAYGYGKREAGDKNKN